MFEMKRKFLGYVPRDDSGDGGGGQGGDSSGGGWGNNGYGMSGGFGGDSTNSAGGSAGGWSNTTSPTNTYGAGYGGLTTDTGSSYSSGGDTLGTSTTDWGGLLSQLGQAYNSNATNSAYGDSNPFGATSVANNTNPAPGTTGTGYSPTSGYGFNDTAFGTNQATQTALGQLANQNQSSPQSTGWGDLGTTTSDQKTTNMFGPSDQMSMASTSPSQFSQQALQQASNYNYANSPVATVASWMSKLAPYASAINPALGMGLSGLGLAASTAGRAVYGADQNGASIGSQLGGTLGSSMGPLGSIAGSALGSGLGAAATGQNNAAAIGAGTLGSGLLGATGNAIAGPLGGLAAGQLSNALGLNNGSFANNPSALGNASGSAIASGSTGGNSMGGVLGSLAQLYADQQAINQRQSNYNSILSQTDPNSQYRSNYAQQLNNLVTNPSSILSNPAYKMQYDLAMQNATRAAALGGGLGNGGAVASIGNAASTAASNAYQSQLAQLANLSQANGASVQAQNLAQQQLQLAQQNRNAQLLKLAGLVGNNLNAYSGGNNTLADLSSFGTYS